MDNNQIREQVQKNKNLMGAWTREGITSQTELTVDINFYSAKKENAEALKLLLEGSNYEVKIIQTRTLIFLKGYKITTFTKEDNWSFEKLNDYSEMFMSTAAKCGCIFEGFGAFMPK